jgi:hypothetical protein
MPLAAQYELLEQPPSVWDASEPGRFRPATDIRNTAEAGFIVLVSIF